MSDTHDQAKRAVEKALQTKCCSFGGSTTWANREYGRVADEIARAVLDVVSPQEDALGVLRYIAAIDPACLQSDLEIEWYNRAKRALPADPEAQQ